MNMALKKPLHRSKLQTSRGLLLAVLCRRAEGGTRSRAARVLHIQACATAGRFLLLTSGAVWLRATGAAGAPMDMVPAGLPIASPLTWRMGVPDGMRSSFRSVQPRRHHAAECGNVWGKTSAKVSIANGALKMPAQPQAASLRSTAWALSVPRKNIGRARGRGRGGPRAGDARASRPAGNKRAAEGRRRKQRCG